MLLVVWLALVSGAALYELAVAIGFLGLGDGPGEGPPGDSVVLLVAGGALLVGGLALGLASAWASFGRTFLRTGWLPLVAPVAVAFALCRWVAYDPYYAPGLRRLSEGGLVPGTWIVILTMLATVAGVAARLRLRAALGLTATVLLLSAATAFASGLGH